MPSLPPLRLSAPTALGRLVGSNLGAQASEQIALAAAPLVAVLWFHATPAGIGWLQTAQTLPFLILSLPAGLIVDRAGRRPLMIGAEALRTLSLLAVPLLLAAGALGLPGLAALGFLGAIGTVCYSVAAPALVPALVPRARLAQANRALELGRSLAFAAGPALGGALLGWTGPGAAYGIAAALSLGALALLVGLPREGLRPAGPRRRILHDLKEGAAFVAGHPLLRPTLVTATVFNLAWFVLQAVYVAYAVRDLGLSPEGVGLTLGAYGAGMVAGALAAPRLGRHLSFGRLVAVGPLSGFVASLMMLATLWWPSGLLAGASFFLFGAGPILWTITTTTLRQAVTPEAMLGRVSALVVTATAGARPLGAALGALVAARLGVGACLAVACLGFLVQFGVIAISSVPRLRALPEVA